MRLLSKVVWSEGMYLGPHHFQAQNSYFEDLIQFVSSALWYEPYGFVGYQLDADALANGTISLVHARGFFSDGLPFHMPELDPLPEPISVGDAFSPVNQSLDVSLAVPARTSEGLVCAVPGAEANHHVRYTAVEQVLCDETTGRDERKVRLGRKNIRFRLGTDESEEEVVTLPLARVMKDGSGHYVYDQAFIPPCLKIDASQPLMLMARRLIEILQNKSSSLSKTARGGTFAAGFSARDVATFWYLHSINAALASLSHVYFSTHDHPETLFVEMLRLAGALCTFKLGSHPGNLPLYDHRDLEKCFGELDAHIRLHLEALLPDNCVSIPLRPAGNYIFTGNVTDQRCLDRARWILGIYSQIGEVDLISRTPVVVKMCSARAFPKLVERALPGLELTHLGVPPAAVSRRPEFQYFGVTRSGPCWNDIVKTRTVGVYIPGELPNPELELTAILEG